MLIFRICYVLCINVYMYKMDKIVIKFLQGNAVTQTLFDGRTVHPLVMLQLYYNVCRPEIMTRSSAVAVMANRAVRSAKNYCVISFLMLFIVIAAYRPVN